MIDCSKPRDRTLLGMHTGPLIIGIVCQIVSLFFVEDVGYFSAGLWFGIALSVAASIHMARTLDIALSDPSRTAKVLVTGYVVRYALFAVILVLLAQTKVFSPLAAFLGYMSLKFTAYLQPFTHKFYLCMFHETDPEPEDLPCAESLENIEEISSEEEEQS